MYQYGKLQLNCCHNDSQVYFAHEGLAVQCCKDETPVAVWITALVVAFLTSNLCLQFYKFVITFF